MKKKVLSGIALTLCLLFLIGCGGNSKMAGSWVISELSTNGMSIDPAMMGYVINLELKSNGKFSLTMDGQSGSGTWSMNGNKLTLKAAGGDLILTYDGTYLSGTIEGVGVKFSKKS